MLTTQRVKRIFSVMLAVLMIVTVVVTGVMFSGTEKSKSDILGMDDIGITKLAASGTATASDSIFDVKVEQNEINKITVTGTVDLTQYSGSIALRVGTDVLFSQIFGLTPDASGAFESTFVLNTTFALEFGNEVPVAISYGEEELIIGTVGVVTYDYASGILGYPEGATYLAGGVQTALTVPYVPANGIDEDGNATVFYESKIFTFKANELPVAAAPEKGTDGVYDQKGVDSDNDGEIDAIKAFINTTAGREYAIVELGGSVGADYGIPASAWIDADTAKEIDDLVPGKKYNLWVRVAGVDGELLASAPVFLGSFTAMKAEDATAIEDFLAYYDEVTVTNGHKLYTTADTDVTATYSEVAQLITLYNKIPADLRADEDIADKGEYLVISKYLANYQDIIDTASTATKYAELRDEYGYKDMLDAVNDFKAIKTALGEAHLDTDADYLLYIKKNVDKLEALLTVDANDVNKDAKYEAVDYYISIMDMTEGVTAEILYNADVTAEIATLREEFDLLLFLKKYEYEKLPVTSDGPDMSGVPLANLEAMFEEFEGIEAHTAIGDMLKLNFAKVFYFEISDRYVELVTGIDAKGDTEAVSLKDKALDAYEMLSGYVTNGTVDPFMCKDTPAEIYAAVLDAIDVRFAYVEATNAIAALKNGTTDIDAIADAYIFLLKDEWDGVWNDVFDVSPDLAPTAKAGILEIKDMAEKEIAYELAYDKALADIAGMKDGSNNVDAAANKYPAELEKLVYGYDVYAELMADISEIVAAAKAETDFEKAANVAKVALEADVADKKASGRYNSIGKSELDAKLAAAIVNVYNIDYFAGKTVADIDAAVATAKADFNTVKVIFASVGGGSEYAENATELSGNITNANGFDSALTLSVKIVEGKEKLEGKKVSVVTGDFSNEKALAVVDGKEVVLNINIALNNGTVAADNGYYTVKILLPKELRDDTGLQLVSEKDGTTYLYETVKAGAYLVVKVTELGDYQIIADKTVNLVWLVVLLAVLLVAEIAVVVFFIVKKKKKAALVAVAPFLAIVYAPAGIVPAAITLGALAAVGAAVTAVVVVNGVKGDKKDDAQKKTEKVEESPAPKTNEEPVAEEATDSSDLTTTEAVAEEAVEEQPVEEPAPEVVEEVEEAVEEPAPEVVEEVDETPEIVNAELEHTPTVIPMATAEEDNEEEEPVLDNDIDEDAGEDKKVFADEKGERVYVTYDYSFRAKLMLSNEEVQGRYALISDTLLSYGLKFRESWKKERYFLKGKTYANITFRGKTLCVYLAIAPESLEGTKYFYENVSGVKKYESIPVMVRVRSGRGCRYAVELIKMMFEAAGLVQKRPVSDTFNYRTATKDELAEMGFIKVMMTDGTGEAVAADFEKMRTLKFASMPIMKKVTVEEAHQVPDEEVEQFIETEDEKEDELPLGRRKGIVNIDSISDAYNDGDEVTVKSLIEKKLLPKNTHFVKILARGALDKALTVKAHDFSMDAAKMIIIAGGSVVKLKAKR